MGNEDQPPAHDGGSAELARVTAERDALLQRVARLEDRQGRRLRFRKVVAAVLVVLVSLTFSASVVAIWAERNFLDTTVFSQRVGPLAEDPAMKAALTRKIGDEVVKVIDAKRVLASFLPERAQVLAVPLANAVESFVRGQARSFVDSKSFDRLWAEATLQAHRLAVAVLRGEESKFASTRDGKVVLNLVPTINQVLAAIGEQSPEIFGRQVNLPTLTVSDAPAAAVNRLESALGIDLSDGYGQVTVFDSDELSHAQDAIALFERLTVVLVMLTVVLIPLTLWASPHRRRTLLQMTVGVGLGLLVVRRLSYRLEGDLLALTRVDDNRAAVEAALGVFAEPLRTACAWLLAGLAALAAAALVSGSYPSAVRFRLAVVRGARGLADITTHGARDPRAAAWLRAHRDQVRVGEAVVALLALLVFHLSWLALLLLAVAIGLLELFFALTGHDQGATARNSASGPPAE